MDWIKGETNRAPEPERTRLEEEVIQSDGEQEIPHSSSLEDVPEVSSLQTELERRYL